MLLSPEPKVPGLLVWTQSTAWVTGYRANTAGSTHLGKYGEKNVTYTHCLPLFFLFFILHLITTHHIMILIIKWLNHLDFKPALCQIECFLSPLDTIYFTHLSGKEPSVWKGEWKLDFWLLIIFKWTKLICYYYFSLLLVRWATLAVRYCPVASCRVKVLPMSHE